MLSEGCMCVQWEGEPCSVSIRVSVFLKALRCADEMWSVETVQGSHLLKIPA